MSESEHPPKNKKTIRNIVYSFLVFYASFYVFAAILDRAIFTKPSFHPQFNAGSALAIGLSIAVGVVFYKWLYKRSNRERGSK